MTTALDQQQESQPTQSERPFDLVIFDFDGTLANTTASIVRIVSQIFTEMGIDPENMGDISRVVGPPFPDAFVEIYDMDRPTAEHITQRYRELSSGLTPEDSPLFEGVTELLYALTEKNIALGIASSKKEELLHLLLKQQGIFHLFDAPCGKQRDGQDSKADSIRRVLTTLNIPLENACMVGDRKYDILAAQEVGLTSIGVTWAEQATVEELSEAKADHIVHNFEDLAALLGL